MTLEDRIFEKKIELASGRCLYLAILIGGFTSENPTQYMNNKVSKYIKGIGYNEYIDVNLDNPWVRVIITDLNNLKDDIDFKKLTDQTLQQLMKS
jgi:hypothetical protein